MLIVKKRYQVGVGNQLLVPWRRNELEAEVAVSRGRFAVHVYGAIPAADQ